MPCCTYRVLLDLPVWFDLSDMSSAAPNLRTEFYMAVLNEGKGELPAGIGQYFTNDILGQASKLWFNQLYLF